MKIVQFTLAILLNLLISISFTTTFSQNLKRYKTPKQDKEDHRVFNVTKNTDLFMINRLTRVGYKPYSNLKQDLFRKKSLHKWSKEEYEDELAKLPQAGYLEIYIQRISIDAANTKWLTVIVNSIEGEELYRKTLESDIAETPIRNNLWWNLKIVPLYFTVKGEFYVYVIDDLYNLRFEYIVKP